MKKIIILIFCMFLYADVVNNSNLKVLDALDIEESFLTNEKLQKTYKEYTHRKKRYFLNILENGYDILPIIRESIKHYKIPPELVSVAMAESYFMLDAKSHKKARGLWQFIPTTAKKYGLKIDKYVDERLDPIKSTKAAIEYLMYLHYYFKKWYLAIMAYNAGEGRVVEAVVRAKVDKLCKKLKNKCATSPKIKEYRNIIKEYQTKGRKVFYKVYKLYKNLQNVDITLSDLMTFQKGLDRQYLPKETREYIIKILAMSFLFNNNDFIKYSNSYILNSGVLSSFAKVYVPGGTSLRYVASLLNMSYEQLKSHNLHIKGHKTPPYKYYIYIPYKKLAYFKSHFKRKFFYTYKVQKGDSLIKIAKKFDVKVKDIKKYNKLKKYLRVGESIVIPLKSPIVKYKVRKGDTIRTIAKRFGVSYKKIIKLNDLSSSLIRIGQVLKIPKRF